MISIMYSHCWNMLVPTQHLHNGATEGNGTLTTFWEQSCPSNTTSSGKIIQHQHHDISPIIHQLTFVSNIQNVCRIINSALLIWKCWYWSALQNLTRSAPEVLPAHHHAELDWCKFSNRISWASERMATSRKCGGLYNQSFASACGNGSSFAGWTWRFC